MTTYTARTPVDLLAIAPHVIGFHPEDSAVLLTFGSRGPARAHPQPSFHARVDLPVVESEQRAVARMLRKVVGRHRAGSVGLVVYSRNTAAARTFAAHLVAGLSADGVEVIDVIRADRERFYPVDDPGDPGTPYDLSGHPYTAAGVLEGRVVYENRQALRDSLVGADEEDAAAVDAAAHRFLDGLTAVGTDGGSLGRTLAEHAAWVRFRLHALLSSGDPVGVDDAARLLVLVSFGAVREVAWASMTRARAARQVELWRGLVRRAPADLRAGASGLLAFAAWLAGDGALAWCAIDRCLETEPEDPLARYVASLVGSAVPPGVWTPRPHGSLRIFNAFGTDQDDD